MSCGFVLVSHSVTLAEATAELAAQMSGGRDLVIELAAGTGDGDVGTDAMAILAALEAVGSRCDDVVVFTDLGSAIMSAQTALEFAEPDLAERCHLSRAPFVEGAVAAAAKAAAGKDWRAVETEARRGLAPKEALIDDGLASTEAQRAPVPSALPAVTEAAAPARLDDPFSPELPRLEYTLALNPDGYVSSGDPERELERFEVARARAQAALERIAQSYDRAGTPEGAEVAETVRTLAALVGDRRLSRMAAADIARTHDAFAAVEQRLETVAGKVAQAPSPLLREQAIDVRVVSRLILGALAGNSLAGVANGREITSPCVLVLPELDGVSAALLRPGPVTAVEVHEYTQSGHGPAIARALGVPVRRLAD